jgi:FkbM family methyltransferase
MNRFRIGVQRALLSTYELANRTGLLDSSLAEHVFQRAYFAYKYLVEDPFARLVKTRPELFANGDILDVGANIGYTASLFARAVTAPHRVHAFEPEERNFRWLEHAIQRAELDDRIVAHRAAVGAHEGTIDLWHNPGHHADHRIATDEQRATAAAIQQVPITSLDAHVARAGWPPVAFVKIDVQGFEPEVLRGMGEVIARNPKLHVAVELAPAALADLGFDPRTFLRELAAALPRLAILERDGTLHAASADHILARTAQDALGYVDLVCAIS